MAMFCFDYPLCFNGLCRFDDLMIDTPVASFRLVQLQRINRARTVCYNLILRTTWLFQDGSLTDLLK